MSEFNATLLREKFVISDAMPSSKEEKPVVALSNRMMIPLHADDGDAVETFVVRAQNMHTCVRYCAQIARDFQENGPLTDRAKPFDWEDAYKSIVKGFEEKYNANRWVAVYHKGRIVFQGGPGERHAFLDIIEQCDARNKGDYDKSLDIAKDAFRQAGRLVNIEHDANIALIMNISKDEGRCGVIVRGPNRTTTFNFIARKKRGNVVRPSQCLGAAAAFLEGIQLSFMAGMTREKLRYELISSISEEAHKGNDAGQKLGRLNAAVSQFETILDVVYRPDRPDFGKMVEEAEEFARKALAKQIKDKIDSGEMDSKDWVT